MAMLDNIRIRRLRNGYTVKHHIQTMVQGQDVAGVTDEVYVEDKKALAAHVAGLIEAHIGKAGEVVDTRA